MPAQHLEPYGGYDENLYVDVFTEFSTAAFRLAHSQINSFQLRLDADGNTIPAGNITLADVLRLNSDVADSIQDQVLSVQPIY